MPETDPASVKVSILDRTFELASENEQSAEYIRQVAQLVDETIRQAQETDRTRSLLHAVVMAGLNLVDELFRLRADYETAESDIAQRTSRLTTSLGEFVPDPGLGASSQQPREEVRE